MQSNLIGGVLRGTASLRVAAMFAATHRFTATSVGKEHGEDGAAAFQSRRRFGAAHMDRSAVVADDLVAYPEAESRAGSPLGRKERVEDGVPGAGTHAYTVIRHRDPNTRDAGKRVMRLPRA